MRATSRGGLTAVWRLAAIVVPLALDSFAVCAGLAAGGLSAADRRRIAIAFPAFEIAMPVVGLAAGRGVADAAGRVSPYVAAAVLAAVGGAMLIGDDERTVDDVPRFRGATGLALVVATSLDELALGFTIGLLRLSIAVALAVIAVQAVLASQLGLALGTRLSRRSTAITERVGGAALIVVAAVVLALEV